MPEKNILSEAWEFAKSLAVAALAAAIIITYVVQPFVIPSGSMEPILRRGDRILVVKFAYVWREPARGDVIVFKYPPEPASDFVKRALGLPGDTVAITRGKLFVNGAPVAEPYLTGSAGANFGPVTVPEGHYFMLGDNRPTSKDSRSWGFVPRANLRGRAVVIIWPIHRVRGLR